MPLPVGPPPINDENINSSKNTKNGINYNKTASNSSMKQATPTVAANNERYSKRNTNKSSVQSGATRINHSTRKENNPNTIELEKNIKNNRNITETKTYFSETIDGEEWRTDKQTGRKYKVLPPTEWNDDGTSVCHMGDVDGLTDLNAAASTYLSHLQVPPTKKELSDMRAENAAKRQQKKL